MLTALFQSLKQHTKAFSSCRIGLAYLEVAIVLPVLLLLFLGVVEVCRFILITQKLENTVSMVTDVVAQYNVGTNGPLTSASLAPLYSTVQDMVNPYNFGTRGVVVLTDVLMSGGTPVIQWQSCGGGTLAPASTLGSPGANANFSSMPGGGFAMVKGEEIVVGEIFYNYSPLTMQNVLTPMQLYRTSVYAPRLNPLASPTPPTCP